MKNAGVVKSAGALALGLGMAALAVCCAVNLAPISSHAQCGVGFEGFSQGDNGRYLFRQPSYSGSTSAYVDTSHTNYSAVSGDLAHSGTNSLKVEWLSTSAPANWLRLTTSQAPVLRNPQIKNSQILTFWIYVPSATPDFYLTVGLRENTKDLGCGLDGGIAGTIEWVGAAVKNAYNRPMGKLIGESKKDQWVEMKFVVPCEPVLPFPMAGANGILGTPQAVFEHLAFIPVTPGAVGPYVIYLDDFAIESTLSFPEDQVVNGTCAGVATWTPAQLVEDCGAALVSSSYDPGDPIGFGTTAINTYAYYPISGAWEYCTYNVTVLPPPHLIEFLSPVPNLDAPHLIAVGETIPVIVRMRCDGQELTQGVTVKIDVKGLGPDGAVFHDVDEQAFGVGDSLNKALVLVDHHFMFNLTTLGFVRRTASNDSFYLVQIIATHNASGLELGRGSVVLESR